VQGADDAFYERRTAMRDIGGIKSAVTIGLLVAVVALGAATAYGYHETLEVMVNGRRLSPQEIRWFEQRYGVRAQSGRYWYDPRSGQLGREQPTYRSSPFGNYSSDGNGCFSIGTYYLSPNC
jgi:hypothetical protein